MTTPIPEAAVEAAERALTPSQWAVYDNLVASGETTEYPASSIIAPSIETAMRLLTAARPLMEAEIRGQVALPTFPQGDDDAAIKESEARLGDAGYKPHLKEWERLAFLDGRNAGWKEAREYIAAAIAERTNDEPA